MKKTFLLLATGMAMHGMYAQVGIETTDPQATLDVNGDVRIQNSSTIDIPSHKDCPCFLVVDKQGKVKRVPMSQGTGSGSGGSTGGGGTTVVGGVSPVDGGVSNPQVLKPKEVVEIGWFTENFDKIELLVNLPDDVPYSAFMSPEISLPTVDGGTQNFRITYPKGTTKDGKITATLLIGEYNSYLPKLIFTPAEETEYEMTLFFNGVEQSQKLKFKATVNAVTNQEHGNTFTYPVTKIGDTYLMAMNLGAQYAEEATGNPGVLKTWKTNQNWQTDYKAYGSLFQWGQPANGAELVNWTSSTSGTLVNPGMPMVNYNQLTTFTNPCPTGYHVPTYNEWGNNVLKNIEGINNPYDATTSTENERGKIIWESDKLHLAYAGTRNYNTNNLRSQGDKAQLHLVHPNSGYPSGYRSMYFYANNKGEYEEYRSALHNSGIADGISYRCIKD